MNYIVFDLEWNQSPQGKQFSNPRLPFEIIEIGAVRMNEHLEILDSFQCLIQPSVYHWIHNSIHDVIHVDYKDLQNGVPFARAASDFFAWAGRDGDYCFCTWGDQDVMELQRNLDYYHLLKLLPGPVVYLDIQKLFALEFETYQNRRSLEYAIDFLKIEKNHGFHRALEDAHFTGEVMSHLNPEQFASSLSLDCYQHPSSRKDETLIEGPGYSKYVSREFLSKERALRDREVSSTCCPICKAPSRRTIRWFSNNSKAYYCLALCKEHGEIMGKIRIRKIDNNRCFAMKTLRLVSYTELGSLKSAPASILQKQKEEIIAKRELLRQKQHQHKSQEEV